MNLAREYADLVRRLREYNYQAWLHNAGLAASALVCPDSCEWRGLPHAHGHDVARDRPYIRALKE